MVAPYKYKDRLSRCRDVLYRDLYNGNSYTDKTTSLLRQAPGDLIQADVIKKYHIQCAYPFDLETGDVSKSENSEITRSMPWLLGVWLLTSSGH